MNTIINFENIHVNYGLEFQALKNITLKDKFPNYKFSVTSSNFSGGDSVHID